MERLSEGASRGPAQGSGIAPWVPPSAEEPSAWQRAAAAELLARRAPALAERLAAVVRGQVQLAAVTVVPATDPQGDAVALGAGCHTEPAFARLLASAALGFDAVAAVDLDGAPERALLGSVGQALRQWVRCGWPCPDPAVLVLVRARVGETHGVLALVVGWQELWASAERELKAQARPLRVPQGAGRVGLRAVVRGPDLAVDEVMLLRQGDLMVLPAEAGSRAVLAVHGAPVALGKLGASDRRWAVRVDRLPAGGRPDG